MFQSIKKIAEMNKKVANITYLRDESEMLVIPLSIKDDSNFISPFSLGGAPLLSREVADFLESSLRPKHFKEDLHIKICSNEIDEQEQPIYRQAIKNYFSGKYVSEQHHQKRRLIVSLFMLMAGILSLLAVVGLQYFNMGSIFIEVADIVAWVFLWEAADIFFLERIMARWEQYKNIALSSAKISFVASAGK